MFTLLFACGMLSPPPEPSALAHESLGGIVLGAPFDRTGFDCEQRNCTRPAEIAGLHGDLIVTTCEGIANQIVFRERFYWPDSVAAKLDEPSQSDERVFLDTINPALQQLGFVAREASPEEVAELSKHAQIAASGRKLNDPVLIHWDHPDGRKRLLVEHELPGGPESSAIDPNASVFEVKVGTDEVKLCTEGL